MRDYNDSVGFIFKPRLSPDNINVAIYWNRHPHDMITGLWILSRKDSSQKLLLKGFVFPLEWSKDGIWIYAIKTVKTPQEILMVNANTGLTKFIFALPPGEVEPDGDIGRAFHTAIAVGKVKGRVQLRDPHAHHVLAGAADRFVNERPFDFQPQLVDGRSQGL